jgi:hypothetical protein
MGMKLPDKMVVSSDLERSLIFKSLQRMKEPMHVTVEGIEYQGYITAFDDTGVTLKVDSPIIGELEGTNRVNFVFNNNYHYFTGEVMRKDDSHVMVLLPDKIYKNILRKHRRVNVEGRVGMKFKIMIQSEKQDLENSALVDERVVFQEVRKIRPSIEKLLRGIKNLVSEFSQNMQVRIFKQQDSLSFEERVIKDTKKAFLIYDSYKDTIGQRRFYEEHLLTVGGVYEFYIARGDVRTAVEGRLLDMLQQKRNRRIFSECYMPMMLEGEAVDCLRLTNDVNYHRNIKPAFVERAIKYAGILVEALVKYDYFRLESGGEYDIPVVNISAGGLLFKLTKENLRQYLIDQTVLQMSVRFPARLIETRGVIFRIVPERSEYGVKFQEISELDARYIESMVQRETDTENSGI